MGVIKEFLSKLQVGVIIFVVVFTSFVLLALPQEIIINFKLDSLIENYKMYFTLAVIGGFGYYLLIIINFIKDKYANYRYKKEIKNFIEKEINKQEIELLIYHFYIFDRQEFISNVELDITHGTVAALINKGILIRPSSLSRAYTTFALVLHPIALEHLNYLVRQKSIVISGNNTRFKYNWPKFK